MKKRFYEEPEVDIMTFNLINTTAASSGGGLVVQPDPDNGGGDGDSGDYEWGGIY